MELKKVSSSQVDVIGWENDILVVRFKTGAVYLYSKVPYSLFESLLSAGSVGHALNESLKYKEEYPCIKLTA